MFAVLQNAVASTIGRTKFKLLVSFVTIKNGNKGKEIVLEDQMNVQLSSTINYFY